MQIDYSKFGAKVARPVTPRFLLYGPPGTGKTYSALSFPNPIVADFDHKCPMVNPWTKEPVQTLEFWNDDFCDSYARRMDPRLPANRMDAFLVWLRTIGPTLPVDVTLIVDSLTMLGDAAYVSLDLLPRSISSKTGKPDEFELWERLKDFYVGTCSALKTLPCNIVVIAHEEREENDKGQLTGYKPLTRGKFRNQLASHFTDAYRMFVQQDTDPNKAGAPKGDPSFWWYIAPSELFGCITSIPRANKQLVLPANYQAWKAALDEGEKK